MAHARGAKAERGAFWLWTLAVPLPGSWQAPSLRASRLIGGDTYFVVLRGKIRGPCRGQSRGAEREKFRASRHRANFRPDRHTTYHSTQDTALQNGPSCQHPLVLALLGRARCTAKAKGSDSPRQAVLRAAAEYRITFTTTSLSFLRLGTVFLRLVRIQPGGSSRLHSAKAGTVATVRMTQLRSILALRWAYSSYIEPVTQHRINGQNRMMSCHRYRIGQLLRETCHHLGVRRGVAPQAPCESPSGPYAGVLVHPDVKVPCTWP